MFTYCLQTIQVRVQHLQFKKRASELQTIDKFFFMRNSKQGEQTTDKPAVMTASMQQPASFELPAFGKLQYKQESERERASERECERASERECERANERECERASNPMYAYLIYLFCIFQFPLS